MFEFIKNIFKSSTRSERREADEQKRIDDLDVVETHDLDGLKSAEFCEGAPTIAVHDYVDQHDLEVAQTKVESAAEDVELPAAQLDEPTDGPAPSEEIEVEADNFLTGDLTGARMLRNIQAREAAVAHWNSSTARYRPRQRRASTEGTAARNFEYFDALQSDPQLRQQELENPGMSMDSLSLNKFLSEGLKGQMIDEYVNRSIESIHNQIEDGMPPLQTVARQRFGGTSSGVTPAAEHKLRGMFDAYEIKQAELKKAKEEQIQQSNKLFEKNQISAEKWDEQQPMDGNFQQVDKLFEAQLDNERDENYTRWLLTVAEEATESDDVLWLLVQDSNPDVRFCLAENYDINSEILQALSMDENPYVAHRAIQTLNRLEKQGGIIVDHDFSSAVFQQRKSS